MSSMFQGCEKISSLNLAGFDVGKVKNFQNMFYNYYDSNLTSLTLWNTDTVSAENMSGVFYGCKLLTSIDLSTFKTGNVSNFRDMFNGCSGLTSLDVSGFDTKSATNLMGMFSYCSKIETLNVTNWNVDLVENLGGYSGYGYGGIFHVCTNLKNIDLSKWNGGSVKYITQFFNGCRNLSEESLNSILKFCPTMTQLTNKTLKGIAMPAVSANKCPGLSNYAAFTDAGWTTGY